MERAVVSTSCGCAGLELEHPASVWIADTAEEFVQGVATLIRDPDLRRSLARAARLHAEAHFDWKIPGELQSSLWHELASAGLVIRPATGQDLPGIQRIQGASPEAVAWEPASYLSYDCRVATLGEHIAGFVVSRRLAAGEAEILNLAVNPKLRRHGIGAALVREVVRQSPGNWFLEVRESNLPARNLYRKFGFEEVDRRPNYYQDNGEDAVVMRRQSC